MAEDFSKRSILEHCQLQQIGDDAYETILPAFGHKLWPQPYGGGILAGAITAARQTQIDEERVLYSLTGSYLGGSKPGKLRFKVTRLRDTRTFSTRSILVTQLIDGNERSICIITADFIESKHHKGFDTVEYCQPTRAPLDDPLDAVDQLPDMLTFLRGRADEGKIEHELVDQWQELWAAARGPYEVKHFRSSILAEMVFGLAPPETETSQDKLAVHERYTQTYVRGVYDTEAKREWLNSTAKETGALPISKRTLSEAAIVWTCDAGPAEIGLYATKGLHTDMEALFGLDFAYRILTHDFDFYSWNIMQWLPVGAANGRSLGESRIYSPDGKLLVVCSMSGLFRQHSKL